MGKTKDHGESAQGEEVERVNGGLAERGLKRPALLYQVGGLWSERGEDGGPFRCITLMLMAVGYACLLVRC